MDQRLQSDSDQESGKQSKQHSTTSPKKRSRGSVKATRGSTLIRGRGNQGRIDELAKTRSKYDKNPYKDRIPSSNPQKSRPVKNRKAKKRHELRDQIKEGIEEYYDTEEQYHAPMSKHHTTPDISSLSRSQSRTAITKPLAKAKSLTVKTPLSTIQEETHENESSNVTTPQTQQVVVDTPLDTLNPTRNTSSPTTATTSDQSKEELKPKQLPGGEIEYAENARRFSTARAIYVQNRRYILGVITRLNRYQAVLQDTLNAKHTDETESIQAFKKIIETIDETSTRLGAVLQEVMNQVNYLESLNFGDDSYDLEAQNIVTDVTNRRVDRAILDIKQHQTHWDGTVLAMVDELGKIRQSKGEIKKDSSVFPKSKKTGKTLKGTKGVYDPYRGRKFRGLSRKNPEKKPGGHDSMKATMWEKNMPLHSAAHYLWDALNDNFEKDQIGFIQVMRLLSRPDVHEVENAFVSHPSNKTGQTLREVLVNRYGKPNTTDDEKAGHRSKYLFELLDNGGKATNTTRLALALGLMERGLSWARFVTDEDEVVRLAELADPHELAPLWNLYGDTIHRNLNTYNYKRLKNFVAANRNYASIKATAKGIKSEKETQEELDKNPVKNKTAIESSKEKQKGFEAKLGKWQRDLLTPESGVYTFLEQKDKQLAAIVKNFSAGANKYTGRWWFSLKTSGYVKDTAKQVDAWLKTVAKEEKTYFNNKPVIRSYIAGKAMDFKTSGDPSVTIPINPPKHTHYLRSIEEGEFFMGKSGSKLGKLGGGLFALGQYPASLVVTLFTLGRHTLLKPKQRQALRSTKIGWNSGDRKFLRYLVEAGIGEHSEEQPGGTPTRESSPSPSNSEQSNESSPGQDQTTTKEKKPTKPDHIQGNDNAVLSDIVKNVRHVIQTRGSEFEVEMLSALVNIARQADITFQNTKFGKGWDNSWNFLHPKRFKINRRQDLVKSLMKLPDRWRVQFLDAFLPKEKSVAKGTTEAEVESRVNEALVNIRKVLAALQVKPKQIYEVIGSLKYGSDITGTYLQLRRYAGKETFDLKKVLQLAVQLNPKELEIAQTDTEMHVGLERQVVKKYLTKKEDGRFSSGVKQAAYSKFLEVCGILGITPQYRYSGGWFTKEAYRANYPKITSNNPDKANIRPRKSGLLKKKEAGYVRYYWDHIGGKDESKDVKGVKDRRNEHQASLDNLPDTTTLGGNSYDKKVEEWAQKFSTLIKNTEDHNKMLLMALEVWQAGEEFDAKYKGDLPHYHSDRKTAFLYKVYTHMESTHKYSGAARKFKSATSFTGPIRGMMAGMGVKFVKRLKSGDLNIVEEILKSNYKWFRPASSKDKGFGGGTFERLSGKVLLETWTDVNDHLPKIQRRDKLKQQIRAERLKENPNQSRIDSLGKQYKELDKKIRTECVPMPKKSMLDLLRNTYTNDGSYADMVQKLLFHLSNSAEFDKSFFDALKKKGYKAEDMLTLTEVYKFLAVQEKEKFLTGGSMTTQWKAFTVKSTERKEGGARLVSAMRGMDKAVDDGKVHSTMGDDKGYFYDTFFDEVMERQESYEKTAAKYRKNIGKTLWLLSTAAFIPFSAGIGGLSLLASSIVVSAFFTGQGMAMTLLNSILDPYKHSLGGTVGETAWAGFKGALLSAVFLGSFELKAFAEQMSWGELGGSIESLEKNGGNKAELFWKQAGEYAFRKFAREIGKEMIRGMDKAVREGPKAGLVNFKEAIYNPAIIFEMFTKTMVKMVFSDTVTGAKGALDEAFGGNLDVDEQGISQEEKGKRIVQNFRASELRRDVRRVLYEKMGFKYATKVLEYAVSNRNPAFREFTVKYDVKRKAPDAQASVDHLKYAQDVDEALFDVEVKLNSFARAAKNSGEEIDDSNIPTIDFLKQMAEDIARNNPEDLKDFVGVVKNVISSQVDSVTDMALKSPRKKREKKDDQQSHVDPSTTQKIEPLTILLTNEKNETSILSATPQPKQEQQHSRKQNHSMSGQKGVENAGNSCYIAAGLNMMAFSRYYELIDRRHRELGGRDIIANTLYGILTSIRRGELVEDYRIQILRHILIESRIQTISQQSGNITEDRILTPLQIYSQEDPTEIFGKILDYLKITGITQTSRLSKRQGQEISDTPQNEAFINLPIENANNLEQAMREYFKVETLENVQNSQGRGNADKKLLLGNGRPKVVTIALKRFKRNLQGGSEKDTKTVNMREYFILNGYVYRLDSVVFHLGNSPKGGHYTAKTRNLDGNGWKYRNDSTVSDTDNYDAPDQENPGYIYTYSRLRAATVQDAGMFNLKRDQQ
ncbi:hypothetical protein BKI52_20045 [marine bacterium AO1-C]|nr:hypothetical protein BKI52_20045 [marine bacterium AO1-C]